MKKRFSTRWNASRQPRKQRKYRANAPLHLRKKMLNASLSKELRKKYGRRSFSLRKGDSVIVMKGESKKKKGKIAGIDMKNLRVSIEGLQKTKKDGTKVNILFSPSNLQIEELDLDDKNRLKSISKEGRKAEKSIREEMKKSKEAEKEDVS